MYGQGPPPPANNKDPSFYQPQQQPNLQPQQQSNSQPQHAARTQISAQQYQQPPMHMYAPKQSQNGDDAEYLRYAPLSPAPPQSTSHPSQQNAPQQGFYNPSGYQEMQQQAFYNPQQARSPMLSQQEYQSDYAMHSSPTGNGVGVPSVPPSLSTYSQHQPQQLQQPQQSQQQQHQQHQSSFFVPPPQQQHQYTQQQQLQQQHQMQQQQPQQQNMLGSAMPFMMAGMQQFAASGGGGAQNGPMNAALGAQLFQAFVPGAAGYTNQLFGQSQDSVRSFMRMPKYYFAVNHKYVLKKLGLVLMPLVQRTWARQRGMDPGQFEGSGSDGATAYLPPRDDVNAPDLYIPMMAFATYVLLVGFVFGTRNAFRAEVLAKYCSKGVGVLALEVLIIKLGLYLINARAAPWLDVIAYRGYKFVGCVLTMVIGLLVPKLYLAALVYSATMMGVFLMRSHRRIVLPRDADMHAAQDLARRNAFLLFVWVLQYPIYWVLVLDVR